MAVKNKVRVIVDGKTFTLVGYESEEHLNNVAAYIDQKIKDLRKNSSTVALDHSLAYILASLNVGDDYFKNLERNEALQQQKWEAEKRFQEAEKRQKEAEARLQEAEVRLQEAEKRLRFAEKDAEQQLSQLQKKIIELEQKEVVSIPVKNELQPTVTYNTDEDTLEEKNIYEKQNHTSHNRGNNRIKRKRK